MADGTEHVEELLGLYYLDQLDAASAQRVRAHLDACATCRDEAAQVCEVFGAMALLLDDREELASMYGALGTSVPPAFPARFTPIEEPQEPRSRIGWPHRSRRPGRQRPTESATATDAPAPESAPSAPSTRTAVAPAMQAPTPTVPPAAPVLPDAPPAAPVLPDAPPAAPVLPDAPPAAPVLPDAPPAAPSASTVPAAAPTASTVPAAAPDLPAVSLAVPAVAPVVPAVAATPAAAPMRPKIASELRTKPVQRPAPSTVPAPIPLPTQPAGETRPVRRTRPLIVSIGMLAATVTLGGTAATALLREHNSEPNTPTAPAAVNVAASTTNVDSGVRMAVALTAKDGSTEVRAKLTGLTKGTGYRLYGYGPDDNRWAVVNWTGGAGKEQEVSGTVPAAIAGISHVAVLRSDRKVVVTVYFSHDAEAEIGPNGG
ncbi:zf-HC2 domain-containing protein [Micromonospora zamorensis]|uniref:zf-HC2 domain-containing protein n=1 Tax=Micromonospora zamorensis TaxID=709883 RepID=UPI00369299CA